MQRFWCRTSRGPAPDRASQVLCRLFVRPMAMEEEEDPSNAKTALGKIEQEAATPRRERRRAPYAGEPPAGSSAGVRRSTPFPAGGLLSLRYRQWPEKMTQGNYSCSSPFLLGLLDHLGKILLVSGRERSIREFQQRRDRFLRRAAEEGFHHMFERRNAHLPGIVLRHVKVLEPMLLMAQVTFILQQAEHAPN